MAEAGTSTKIHLKQSPVHIIAFILAGIAVVDLATGSTNEPILPSVIANYLTQQVDLVLLGIAAFLLFFVS